MCVCIYSICGVNSTSDIQEGEALLYRGLRLFIYLFAVEAGTLNLYGNKGEFFFCCLSTCPMQVQNVELDNS